MSGQGKRGVGLVGAGYISAYHIEALRRLPEVEIVGIVDLDQQKAAEVAARHNIQVYSSLRALRDAGASVIHVLTPPDTHARVAMQALELGCHVFVEKPLATDVEEAERLRDVAREKGLRVGVCHSLLFDPQVRAALEAVERGELGQIVSVDILRSSIYPPLGGVGLPPQYRTAGYPFRDLGVHCLYLLEAFLGPVEHVDATWASLGGDPNLAFDEWRALVRCQRGLGQFQLSWNVRPLQSQIVLQGTKGVRRIDLFLMFQATRAATRLPKAAERVVNALTDSIQPLIDVPMNVIAFARKKLRAYQGLQDLVGAFYASLDGQAPAPVEIDGAIRAVKWTEQVARAAERDHASRVASASSAQEVPFLVTGASGALGSALVKRLRQDGHRVRAFVRRLPETPALGVDYVVGDLGDAEAVARAVAGAKVVFHAGAAMKGGWPEHQRATIEGTRHVLDAAARAGVRKLVHVSSLSVVDWAGGAELTPIDESTPYEPRAEERGAYTRAKLEAERLVRTAVLEQKLKAVILRPGQIFGGRIPLLTPAVARRMGGRWLALGDGSIPLPLVYIDDVVDALVLAANSDLEGGEIIQIVDAESWTQNDVLRVALNGESKKVVRVPRPVVFTAGRLTEIALKPLGKASPLSEYRLRSALARRRFESARAERLLGWRPRVGVREGIRRALGTEAHEAPELTP